MKKKVIATITTLAMVTSMFAGCSKKSKDEEPASTNKSTTEATDSSKSTDSATTEPTKAEEKKEDTATEAPKEVKHFKAWFARESPELNQENDVKKLIADKIGADCWETWLVGQTEEEAIGMYAASGQLPDFVNFAAAFKEAELLVPIEDYLDDYPNLKALWNDKQWESLRQEDGHIYSIPQFGNIYDHSMDCVQGSEAWWIQNKVLKWANYPVIETMDQFFDLLRDYQKANPEMPDGTPVIPFEILSYDWLYFCLENVPSFLDGAPNDGKCIVDPKTYVCTDYNTTPTAKKYFQKLNEEYKNGLIDKEFVSMDQEQFGQKVSSGRVLSFVSQHWIFQNYEQALKAAGMDDCIYIPLGITIEPGMHEMYYCTNESVSLVGGLSITTSCQDVKGALQFVNDLLSPEVLTLRMWGEEGKDYLVDDQGIFYRTQEMRDNADKADYKASHLCPYGYFPQYDGMNPDLKNAAKVDQQPGEFYEGLEEPVKECLAAYGAKTYVEMLDNNVILPDDRPWYPIYSYVDALDPSSDQKEMFNEFDNLKKERLPKIVISDDFEKDWNDYMDAYHNDTRADKFLTYLQEEVYARIEKYTGNDVRPEGYVAPEK